MSKTKEKEQAERLRREGTSVSSISQKLNVSKSTVSYWCRDIVLSKKAREKIVLVSKKKSTAGILEYTENLRKKRIIETNEDANQGAKLVGLLSSRDIFMVGLGLYWGEGYKKGSQEFGFTNSDPKMIQFYIEWLTISFGIKISDLIARVSINEAHKSRIKEVELFWSKYTEIPQSQFTKSSLIKIASKKVYTNHNNHFGTLRIKVRRGTRLRRKVLGALESLVVAE